MTRSPPRRGEPDVPRPRKRLGQHFLSDPRILARIVEALAPRADETVIEVGPGRGALTTLLAARCRRLIAIELDRDLAPRLRAQFADRPHVEIVEADVLDVSLARLAGGPFSLIGNVPYYITTPILFHALERPRAERIVLLVQREVADRMSAKAGSDAYGALSVNVQAVANVEIVFGVAAGSFSPPPKVESAVVRVLPRAEPAIGPSEEAAFQKLVQAAFAQRRKQLKSIVRSITGLDTAAAISLLTKNGLLPEARPETLDVAQFVKLYTATAEEREARKRIET